MDYNVEFTPEDHLILNSYKTVIEGLADYWGDSHEFVLHSLENVDKSVIKIINGHHTGRNEGAPITDLALSMLNVIKEGNNTGYISYKTKNKKGEPLKSSTITITGTGNKIIGLLCINFYLNTPFSEVVSELISTNHEVSQGHFINETFADNIEELIVDSLGQISESVHGDVTIPVSLKNKEIIARLHAQGIFRLKDAVNIVADLMKISKNTVYLHLRSIRSNEKFFS